MDLPKRSFRRTCAAVSLPQNRAHIVFDPMCAKVWSRDPSLPHSTVLVSFGYGYVLHWLWFSASLTEIWKKN
jgi:hypothetical protein